jgi:Ca-activated chloride channel homolog
MILLHLFSIKATKKNALKFANFEAISRIKGIDLFSKNITTLLLSCVVIALLVLSLAGLTIKVQKTVSDFSFVIAIDDSESMEANDLSPNRLEAAKNTANEFVNTLPIGSRAGVISFSGNAIVKQEVSDDKSYIRSAINGINLTSIGGTDISEAIIMGVNLLINEPNRAVIILSDGQINVGHLDEAIKYANRYNVVVHTIGVGTTKGGLTSYGLSKLDESSLKSIAYNTNGKYFSVLNNDQLKNSFLDIAAYKKKNVPFDMSSYMLVAAILIFFIVFVLFNYKFRVFP